MKLMLISSPCKTLLTDSYSYPNLGVCYIATYVKHNLPDIDIVLVDGNFENPLEKIKNEKPDLIGISSSSLEFGDTIKIGNRTKELLQTPIFVGGVHITALPHTLPTCFDVGVIGEGEETTLELVKSFFKNGELKNEEIKKIKGLALHDKGGVVTTEPRPFIKNIDEIPHPDLDLYNLDPYLVNKTHLPKLYGRGLHMITSRGCPYHCIFCGSSSFWKTIRFHSAAYVVEEMTQITDRYGLDCINIYDDLFAASKKRLAEIVELIKIEKLHERVAFGCQMRSNLLDDSMAKLLKEMNVRSLGFGFESGSEKILNYLKCGTVTVEENRKALQVASKHGLATSSGFMIGNPNETKNDMEATYRFIIEHPLDYIGVYITTPLPGTQLWNYAKRKGIVSDDMEWNKLNQFFYDNDKILSNMDIYEFKKYLIRLRFAASLSSLRKQPNNRFLGTLKLLAGFIKNKPVGLPDYIMTIKDVMQIEQPWLHITSPFNLNLFKRA